MVSTTAKMRCCSRNGSCSISAESMEAREAAVFSTTSAKIWSAEALLGVERVSEEKKPRGSA